MPTPSANDKGGLKSAAVAVNPPPELPPLLPPALTVALAITGLLEVGKLEVGKLEVGRFGTVLGLKPTEVASDVKVAVFVNGSAEVDVDLNVDVDTV
jgi:hypothetical protein